MENHADSKPEYNPESTDHSTNPDRAQRPLSPPPASTHIDKSASSVDFGHLIGGFFWLAATAMLILAAWYLGPLAIERYQYAATKGRVSAKYENARELLSNIPLNDVSMAFELVAQRIKPSVVSIRADGVRTAGLTTKGGQGSGVIMSEDGYILTNEHVVSGSSTVTVGLHDRRQVNGVVVGVDDVSDLAVVKIDVDGLLPGDWGDSDALNVGSMVWAVGSPYGLEQTVTSGILSAKERANTGMHRTRGEQPREYLQTDAAVNPGNSGGPLVNARGEVVGINTSIIGEQFLGISFAIPSSIGKFVFEEIIADGQVARSYLGVFPRPVSQKDLTRMSLPDLNGAYVSEIPSNGPAYNSDLRVGDVIRNWNGSEVRTSNMLYRFIAMTDPTEPADVDVLREGNPLKLKLSVESRDPEEVARQQIRTNQQRSFSDQFRRFRDRSDNNR